jgi:nitrate/nitrite-specific signal transduction histidine kinase
VLVADDGSGLPAQPDGRQPLRPEHHAGAGARIGGTLDVGPRPGGGTVVRLTFRLGRPAMEMH